MGQTQALMSSRFGEPNRRDEEQMVTVLADGTPWGLSTKNSDGFVRVVLGDEQQTDQQLYDALLPFIEVPDPGNPDHQPIIDENIDRVWRWMSERLPTAISAREREILEGRVRQNAEVYILVAPSPAGITGSKKRDFLDTEKAAGRAGTNSQVIGLTWPEFLATMVNLVTGTDGNGNLILAEEAAAKVYARTIHRSN